MGFHTKYELEKLVHDGPVKTFQAKELSSGKPVFLHLLSDQSEPSSKSLIDRTESLRRLSESAAQQTVTMTKRCSERRRNWAPRRRHRRHHRLDQ